MPIDYYSILAVDRNATEDQIRRRFRQLARDLHPDRYHGAAKAEAEERFQAITEAFNILSNPQRRRQYDQELGRAATVRDGIDHAQLLRVYLQRGIKAYKAKNYFEAAENFNRATKADPQSAQAWHHLALACSHQRRWLSRALTAIAKACELEPMNPSYLKLAGELFARADMPLRAEQYLQKALEWGGDDPAITRALEALRRSSKKGKTGFFQSE